MLLYETASLASGFNLYEPNTLVTRIHRMLKLGLSIQEEKTGGDEDADMAAMARRARWRE